MSTPWNKNLFMFRFLFWTFMPISMFLIRKCLICIFKHNTWENLWYKNNCLNVSNQQGKFQHDICWLQFLPYSDSDSDSCFINKVLLAFPSYSVTKPEGNIHGQSSKSSNILPVWAYVGSDLLILASVLWLMSQTDTGVLLHSDKGQMCGHPQVTAVNEWSVCRKIL